MRTFHTYFQIVYYLFFSIHFILQCATPVISRWETSVSCVQPEAAETLMMLLRVSVPATPIWLLVVEVHPLLIPMLLVTVSYLHHHSSVLAFATLKPWYKDPGIISSGQLTTNVTSICVCKATPFPPPPPPPHPLLVVW